MKLSVVVVVLGTLVSWLSRCEALDMTWKGDGHITFYGSPNGDGTQGGACGYQNTIALGYGLMTAALSTTLFNGGATCGACYELKCKYLPTSANYRNFCLSYTRSIVVTATNLCPPNYNNGWCDPPRNHFDLPMPAFTAIVQQIAGVAPVYYRRTLCYRRGGIRFTMGGNPWFFMILIHNVGGAGDIVQVKIKSASSPWYTMSRNWGSVWSVSGRLTGPLSFQITTSDFHTVTLYNAVGNGWQFGQTWEGNRNL